MPTINQSQSHLLDYLSTAIVLLDTEYHIVDMNASSELLFETNLGHVQGQHVQQLIRLQGSDTPQHYLKFEKILQKVLLTGQAFTHREAILSIGLKDCYVDYTVNFIEDHANQQQFFLIELQPIDRLMKISKEELQEQQHQIARQLVRSVAHEVKNPLAGIRGATQLLARQDNIEKIQKFSEIILSEVDRLTLLTDTMLGSRQLPNYSQINIHQALERVIDLLHSQNPTLQIKRDYDLSLPEVYADLDQLIQVLLNISMNAVQAFQEHQDFFIQQQQMPCLTLRTRVQRLVTLQGVGHRSVLKIEIEDNGIGIPSHLISSIFYPMVTGRAQGTGLGLSIAEQIIRQHGGIIECQSSAGCTLFSIFLPWEHVA
ncbi:MULTISPECIES: nitrogen regulation protein NR(II) [unclassified Acinetobacter]|uniref:nitrogen regulation protein NR(II) n=1 Tax=unclassified Acinetobacter TaxID=196816 RepID=UPI0035B8B2D4